MGTQDNLLVFCAFCGHVREWKEQLPNRSLELMIGFKRLILRIA